MSGLVEVRTYSGYRGEEEPRQLKTVSGWLNLTVLDRWLEEDEKTRARRSCFRVVDEKGQPHTLQYYHDLCVWYEE